MCIFTYMNDKVEQNLAKLPECACLNIRKSARAITQLYDKILRPSNLKGTQFTLLSVIARHDTMTISNLAERLVMERTTLTRNLRPLEKQGLVIISPGSDQRTREVSLTAKGNKTFVKALPLWQEAQAMFEQGLGKQRFQNLLADLTSTVKIANNE